MEETLLQQNEEMETIDNDCETIEDGESVETKSKVDQFVMVNADKFPEFAQMQIREKLEKLDDSRESLLIATPWKNPTTSLLLALFLGGFGADRFFLGQPGLGVIKLLTCGGAGIWAIIDWFTAISRTKNYNLNQLMMRF